MKIKRVYYLLFIFALAKLLFFLTKYHFVEWDEAVYLSIGKYFYSLGKVGLLENIRPPLLPILLGALWKLKLNYILFSDVLELVFSLGCIYMTYKIARLYFSENKSLLAALIFMATPVFFYDSLRIMTEIPSTFFILLATYSFIRKRYLLVGLFLGISFLFKYPFGLMLLPFLLALFIDYLSRKEFKRFFFDSAKIVLVFLCFIVALLLFNYLSYGYAIQPLIDAAFHQNNVYYKVANPFLNFFYFPLYLLISNLFLIFALLGIYYFVKLKKYTFLLLVFVPLLYFTSIVNKQLRFAISFLPFLAIMSSYALFYVYNKVKAVRLYRILFLIFILVFTFMLGFYDFIQYNRFPDERPKIVGEFYMFFPQDFTGHVLTSDPIFAAYNDLGFIPYYSGDPNAAYDRNINSVSAIIYTPYSFPCFNDVSCELSKSQLEGKIKSNILVFSKAYAGNKYGIYLNKNYYNPENYTFKQL